MLGEAKEEEEPPQPWDTHEMKLDSELVHSKMLVIPEKKIWEHIKNALWILRGTWEQET